MHFSPAGFPFDKPGIYDEILGTIQHAPQFSLQFTLKKFLLTFVIDQLFHKNTLFIKMLFLDLHYP